MSRKRLVIVAAIVLALLAGTVPAWAYYALTSSTVDSQLTAASLQSAQSPSVAATGATSTSITWTNPAGQIPGAGYTVVRIGSPDVTVCSDQSTSPCNDTGLTTGISYSYTIQTVMGAGTSWQTTRTSVGSVTPKATPSLTVTDNSGSIITGGLLTFTATLTGPTGSPAPTGTMVWAVTGTAASCSSTSGPTGSSPSWTYACNITNAGAGTYSATASYPGDGFYTGTSAADSSVSVSSSLTPTITSLSPASGPANATNTIVVHGTHLTGTTAVKFGTSSGTAITNVTSSSVTVTAPAQAAQSVDVTVTTPSGTSTITGGDVYTYGSPTPAVTSISPVFGPPAGGTQVTITGANFNSSSVVSFGGTAATAVTFNGATSITATSPSGTATTSVDVTVTTGINVSATSSADKFTWTNVVGIEWTSVTKNGGTLSCSGGGTNSYSCTVSGGGNNTAVSTQVEFVNSSGVASVFSATLNESIPVSYTSNWKSGTGPTTLTIAAGGTASTGTAASGTANGSQTAVMTSSFGGLSATLTVKP